jgi:hypothetical protein
VNWCHWCKKGTVDAVTVGVIEAGSGAGRWVYACGACKAGHRIVPLADHPKNTDGRPRYETGPLDAPPSPH